MVLLAGFLGGAVGALVAESTYPPKKNRISLNPFLFRNDDCEKIFATMLGNILFGGLSALLFWGIYGPLTAYPVIGSANAVAHFESCFLSVGDLMGSLLAGVGEPAFLLA